MDGMELVEEEMDKGGVAEEEGYDTEADGEGLGGLLTLEATGLLNKYEDPGGTKLVDTRNDSNKLIRLAIIWKVWHRWPAGVSFAFNCYRHWDQIILRQSGDTPVILLFREVLPRVTHSQCYYMGSPQSPFWKI